jgi:hypothetical protein
MNSDSFLSVIEVVDEARQVVITNIIEEENIVVALDDDIDEVRHQSSFLALKSKLYFFNFINSCMLVSRSFIFVNINVLYLIGGKELLVMDIDTSSIIQIFQSQEPITYWNWVSEQKLGIVETRDARLFNLHEAREIMQISTGVRWVYAATVC